LHTIDPKPYTLLGLDPAEAKFFTCLDLKDAVFCICLAPQSQPVFAFQWENRDTGEKGQLTWSPLPQGFKNSPTIFRTALASVLKAFSADQHSCILLQYVDDLLLAGQLRRTAWKGHAFSFLFYGSQDTKFLGKSPRFAKALSDTLASTCPRGYASSALRGNRLYVPSQPLRPNCRQIRKFWGAAGFCQIWIPNYSLLAKLLYVATKWGGQDPLVWERQQEKDFKQLKRHSQTPLLWACQM
jgi:hypothetical protein